MKNAKLNFDMNFLDIDDLDAEEFDGKIIEDKHDTSIKKKTIKDEDEDDDGYRFGDEIDLDDVAEEYEDDPSGEEEETSPVESLKSQPKKKDAPSEEDFFQTLAAQTGGILFDELTEKDFNTIKSEEDFFNLANKNNQIKLDRAMKEYKEMLSEASKGLIDHLESGKDISTFVAREGNKAPKYTREEIEVDEEVAKDVLRRYLKRTTKLSPERIEKQINRFGDDVYEEALTAYEELEDLDTKEEQARKLEEKRLQQQEEDRKKQLLKEIDGGITSLNEIIPGKQMTQKMRKELQDSIRGNTPINNLQTALKQNPAQVLTTLAILDKYGVFNKGLTELYKDMQNYVVKATKTTTGMKGGLYQALANKL